MSSIKSIHTSNAAQPAGPYSQAVIAKGLVFVSGQIPADASGKLITGTIEECTEAVFANLSAVLTAAGTSFDNVLKTTVYLADMADFAKMNSVYAKYFDGNNKPSRSCVAARELPKGVKVEIDVVALEGTC